MIRTNELAVLQSMNEECALKNAGYGDGRIMSDVCLDFVSSLKFNPASGEMTVIYSAAYHGQNETFSYAGFSAAEVLARFTERIVSYID